MRTILFLSFALITTVVGSGCSFRSSTAVYDARHHGEGTAQFHPVTSDVARAAAVQVLREKGAESVEEYPDHVVGTWGLNVNGWGSYTGVWFEPCGAGTNVVAIDRRKLAAQIATNVTESELHAELAKKVAQRKVASAK
jgi:hypothetical protein